MTGKIDNMRIGFLLMTIISVLSLVIICAFLFAKGIPTIFNLGFTDFILGKEWRPSNDIYGTFPMIIGSIFVTLGAMIIGIPIGILSAIYLCFYAKGKVYSLLKSGVDLLAGIPSIVYGFFGIMVVVPTIRNYFGGSGYSLLAGSIILGIMILPIVINISETSFRMRGKAYYDGARALGASHAEAVFFVCAPAAKSGVLSSIVLGVGRAIGETMAIVMVAGNQAIIPQSIFKGVRTLTSNIVLEMGYAANLHRDALIATAVVLFIFILIINVLLSYIHKKYK